MCLLIFLSPPVVGLSYHKANKTTAPLTETVSSLNQSLPYVLLVVLFTPLVAGVVVLALELREAAAIRRQAARAWANLPAALRDEVPAQLRQAEAERRKRKRAQQRKAEMIMATESHGHRHKDELATEQVLIAAALVESQDETKASATTASAPTSSPLVKKERWRKSSVDMTSVGGLFPAAPTAAPEGAKASFSAADFDLDTMEA